MAFHPIVDLERGGIWGYEALVRGTKGEPAGAILSQIDEERQYKFDQACRVKAIELAGRLFPATGRRGSPSISCPTPFTNRLPASEPLLKLRAESVST
jgi:EAL domain-containing protein (putative c-di-GMP-specific phosphodiesterase class I)